MADFNSTLPSTDSSDGTPGSTVPSNAIQIGGTDGTNLRAVLTDTSGRVSTFTSDKSGSGTITALNGTVVASLNSASTIIIDVTGTWVATILFEGQNGDGVWNPILGYVPGQGSLSNSATSNLSLIFPCGGFTQVRARASSFTSGTVSIAYNSSIGSQGTQVFNLIPASLVGVMNIKDTSGNSVAAINSQLQTRDVINVSSQYRAQSVTTTAAEALGATTILVNRKLIVITPTNGTIYWGTSNAVTTTTGTPIFTNQSLSLSFTDNVHVFVIAAATTDCRVVEAS